MKQDAIQVVRNSKLCQQNKDMILSDITRWHSPRNEAEKANFEQAVQDRIDSLVRIPEPQPEPNGSGWTWKYHWAVGEWRQHDAAWPCAERR